MALFANLQAFRVGLPVNDGQRAFARACAPVDEFGRLFAGCGTFSSWPAFIAIIAAGVSVRPTVVLGI